MASRYDSDGLIYPPPELRQVIDKTAQFVFRNGEEFESKIKGDNTGSSRLAFLNEDDTYHAYYRAKLQFLKTGDGPLASLPSTSKVESSPENEVVEERDAAPEKPEPLQFLINLPNISALDLDIIKVTALYVAKKGRQYVTQLLSRPYQQQFEFLNPSHSLFGLFNRYVEQYESVMKPSEKLFSRLRLGAFGSEDIPAKEAKPALGSGRGGARLKVLEDVKIRTIWQQYERAETQRMQQQQDEERKAFDEIDWQDFVVVGTVELTEADSQVDLPPPMSLKEARNMTLAQKQMAAMIEDVEVAEVVEQDSVSVPAYAPTPAPAAIKIRKDYQPKTLLERKAAAAAANQTTTCPVCKQNVRLSDMDEHVRIELLNPQYREQRRQLEAKRAQHNALAEGADPSRYVKEFAANRTDIFGGVAEEEAQRRKANEEARKRKERETIVWDGYAASRQDVRTELNRPDQIDAETQQIQKRFKKEERAIAGPQGDPGRGMPPMHMHGAAAIQQQPSNVPIHHRQQHEQGMHYPQPHQQQQQYGYPTQGQFYPPPGMPMYNGPPPPPQMHAPPQILRKASDGSLYPEEQWLQYHSRPIRVYIQLPNAKNVCAQCDGRRITFDGIALTTTIGGLRDRIHAEILQGAIGASRMKLRIDGTKPTTLRQTLAYWNAEDGQKLTLYVA